MTLRVAPIYVALPQRHQPAGGVQDIERGRLAAVEHPHRVRDHRRQPVLIGQVQQPARLSERSDTGPSNLLMGHRHDELIRADASPPRVEKPLGGFDIASRGRCP